MFKSRAAAAVAPAPGSTPQDAAKQALLAVVQVWLDRLQHQAVVTTFFVSIDSLLFSLTSTTRRPDLNDWSNRDLIINASLGGAIIFHVCASIVAYVASFVLIRYRLNESEKKEEDADLPPARLTRTRAASSTSRNPNSMEKQRARSNSYTHRPSISKSVGPPSAIDVLEQTIADLPAEVYTDLRGLVSVYRTHPLAFLTCAGKRAAAHQRTRSRGTDPEAPPGPAPADDPVALLRGMVGTLSKAHTVCAGMSSVGFVLALLGIITYSWTAVPVALGIFASACLGVCGVAAAIALW